MGNLLDAEVQQFDRFKKTVLAAIKSIGALIKLVARRVDPDKFEEESELKVASCLIQR